MKIFRSCAICQDHKRIFTHIKELAIQTANCIRYGFQVETKEGRSFLMKHLRAKTKERHYRRKCKKERSMAYGRKQAGIQVRHTASD